MYLTYAEYISFGFMEMDQLEFDKLIKRAEDVIDIYTNDYYRFNDLQSDVEIRKTKFKKAVASQVQYFHETGSTSFNGMESPATVTIGRTTVSKTTRTSTTNDTTNKEKILSQDSLMYLRGTGLLYRGVQLC